MKGHPADAIYRDASPEFGGPERLERLARNLIRALKDEPILLVLDNFETNLKPQAEPVAAGGQPDWACQDPAWDRCLASLAKELVGSPSRVLITCRRPLAALADGVAHPVLLGPLPSSEAALFLKEHSGLSRMVFGTDAGERALAFRLLNASRFHPLLMDRLARLTADAKLRVQLLQALDTLEKTKDFAQLPALFATRPGNAKELAYLDDALASSLDQLIRDASPDARRLLWMIAIANDPVTLFLLNGVWSRENRELSQLPEELQAEGTASLDVAALVRHLVRVGLATEERTGPEDANPDLTSHELVRERIRAWMEHHPQDLAELTENAIRLAYAERLETVFKTLQHQNMTAALQAGSRALVYCVQARAYDRLGGFASGLVTSTRDPRLLEGLIPHLQTAAESAQEGRPRWSCLCYLADALDNAGHHEACLPFFEQAATQARTVAEAGGEGSQQAWADLATITANWAAPLVMNGDLDAARQRQFDSAEASKRAGNPAINVLARELEALRIDTMQGKVAAALPQVEARLAQVEIWWQRHRSGQPVPEAPDPEFLARVLIGALDIANSAHAVLKDWASALHRSDAILEVKRALERPEEDIAVTRMGRANVLAELGHFGEAKTELEDCLQLLRNNPSASAKVLGSIADLFGEQGDVAQAITQGRRALALHEQLPSPRDRATSHNNLANYLERSGIPSATVEAPRHQLAALVYLLVAGLGQALQTSLRNYAIDCSRANAAGTALAVPRVAELLADPAFDPLEQWLHHRQVDVAELQTAVDRFLDKAWHVALSKP